MRRALALRLGALLYGARRDANLTQRELAAKLGITPRYVRQVERAARFPRPDLIDSWSHHCGIVLSLTSEREMP